MYLHTHVQPKGLCMCAQVHVHVQVNDSAVSCEHGYLAKGQIILLPDDITIMCIASDYHMMV